MTRGMIGRGRNKKEEREIMKQRIKSGETRGTESICPQIQQFTVNILGGTFPGKSVL